MPDRYPPPLQPQFFRRVDETDDSLFYEQPRLVTHIDDRAIEALTAFYGQVLEGKQSVLDLMSSWISHLPDDAQLERVTGVGLNADELAENPRLTEYIVQDLNADPVLPFEDDSFDAAIVSVSVQYLVRPVEVFAEVGRVLKPGSPFAVAYSNRMFPTKAVAIWQQLGDIERADLIGLYFRLSGAFEDMRAFNISPGPGADPVFVVVAKASGA